MFPIFMLTKNRYNYLEATTRNMAKMHLPQGMALHIFDDSTDKEKFEKAIWEMQFSSTVEVHKPEGNNVYEKLRNAVDFMCDQYPYWFYTDDDIIYRPDAFAWSLAAYQKYHKKGRYIGQVVPANTMIEFWLDEFTGVRRAFGAGRSLNNSGFIQLVLQEFKPDNSNNMFDQLSSKIADGYQDWNYLGATHDLTFHFGVAGLHSGNSEEIKRWLLHFAGDQEEARRCLELQP